MYRALQSFDAYNKVTKYSIKHDHGHLCYDHLPIKESHPILMR